MTLTQEKLDKLKEVGYTDKEIERIKDIVESEHDFDLLIENKVKINARIEKARIDEEEHKLTRAEIEKLPGGYTLLQKNDIHQKFINANVAMMASGNLPYYGEFNQYINFHQAKIGTCGVNVSEKGMNFYWDPEFINKLIQNEVNFVTLHEDFHLLFDHLKRSVGYDKKVSNIVQDMIINQTIYDEIMSKPNLKEFVDIPKDEDERNSALFIPKEYPGMYVFEELYEWYIKKYREHRNKKFEKMKDGCPKCGQKMPDKQGQPKPGDCENSGQQPGEQQPGQGGQPKPGDGKEKGKGKGKGKCPHCGQDAPDGEGKGQGKKDGYGKNGKSGVECGTLEEQFDALDRGEELTLDVHLDDQIPEELRKEIVSDIVNKMKARGLETGDMSAILNRLRKSKKDYLKEIKRAIANDIFGSTKSKTITRPNRRNIWGLKGQKKHKNCINVILDTSGSMCGSFEKVLSYVFQNNVQLQLIQIDTKVNRVDIVKNKKQLERVRIEGLGGTCLNPALQFIRDEKKLGLNRYNTVVLSDGYCDRLDFTGIKGKTLILTIGDLVPIAVDNGRVKQIKVDKEKKPDYD